MPSSRAGIHASTAAAVPGRQRASPVCVEKVRPRPASTIQRAWLTTEADHGSSTGLPDCDENSDPGPAQSAGESGSCYRARSGGSQRRARVRAEGRQAGRAQLSMHRVGAAWRKPWRAFAPSWRLFPRHIPTGPHSHLRQACFRLRGSATLERQEPGEALRGTRPDVLVGRRFPGVPERRWPLGIPRQARTLPAQILVATRTCPLQNFPARPLLLPGKVDPARLRIPMSRN